MAEEQLRAVGDMSNQLRDYLGMFQESKEVFRHSQEALEKRLAQILGGGLEKTGAESDKDREVISKYLKMIQEEAFRCKSITQRLLEFSRGGERRREPTDLVELIQSVLDMVQHLPNCKGKEIIFEPAAHVRAWVNSQEIKPVVLNLVVNALDSMEGRRPDRRPSPT